METTEPTISDSIVPETLNSSVKSTHLETIEPKTSDPIVPETSNCSVKSRQLETKESAASDSIAPETLNRPPRPRHLSRRQSSLASLLQDCPICLDSMESTDLSHVLQCERHCGFNMCKNCIGSLITSSKDDFQLASDGNLHVKVYLHCPNCRSDLTHSIRHTLLLRKVEELKYLKAPESEWTTSQVRLKNVLDTAEVQKAIRHAKITEAEYFGRDFNEEEEESFIFDDNSMADELDNDVEQWGVEVDLKNGTHDSFIEPPPPSPTIREEAIRIDPTLFAGLDEFLSEDDRKKVTELMTKGTPLHLVKAAEILYNTLQELSNPNPKPPPPPPTTTTPQTTAEKRKYSRKKSIARRSSIFQLIAEADAAEGRRNVEEKKVAEETQALLNAQSRVAQHRQLERELRMQADFQKRFPIPVRMPKTVKLDLSLPFDMELVDYTWGGTVMDAYSKISIGFGNKITQRRPRNINVANILGTEPNVVKSAAVSCALGLCASSCDDDNGDYSDIYIALPGRSRVLISHTGHIGKLGAVRGDVVTHLDGEDVSGKKVADVLEIIKAKNAQECIMLTLNAELSVADALRRRALAIAEAL